MLLAGGLPLYGRKGVPDVEAPDVAAAWFSSTNRTEITLATRRPDQVLQFEHQAQAGFWVEGSPGVQVTGGRAEGHRIVLTLSQPAPDATAVCYSGGVGRRGWALNRGGIGLLTGRFTPG